MLQVKAREPILGDKSAEKKSIYTLTFTKQPKLNLLSARK